MNKKIPLFPLKLVVFPNSKYPLHIFEERYKKMINRCLTDETGFGIIAAIGDEFSKVGCYVKIKNIINKLDNGEMDIIIEGKMRFELINYEVHSDGYYTGSIADFNDSITGIDDALLDLMQNKFNEILHRFSFHLDDAFWKNYQKSSKKTFKIAEKSGLTIEQQQQLLSMDSENDRMAFLIDHFEKLDKQLTENAVMKSIILGDGYLNK